MEVGFGARIRELFEDEDDFGSQHGPTNCFGGGSKYRARAAYKIYKPKTRLFYLAKPLPSGNLT